jgi:predicted RNase H-like nuclease (RuvC/YqgF family)
MANQDKWPGPITDTVSVADVLAFDALPESTRIIAERVIQHRLLEQTNYSSYEEAYDDGRERGEKIGRDAAQDEAAERERGFDEREKRLTQEIDRLVAENKRLLEANHTLGDTVSTLRSELKVARRASA